MQSLSEIHQESLAPEGWPQAVEKLLHKDSCVQDSIALMDEYYALPLPVPLCYQGGLNLAEVDRVHQLRMHKDKHALHDAATWCWMMSGSCH